MKNIFWFLVFATLFCGAAIYTMWPQPVAAHDWYNGMTDPVTGKRCCGGSDCAQVPAQMMESGAIRETADGFWVSLSIGQVQYFNRAANYAVAEFIPWERAQYSADDGHMNKAARRSGYSLCIWNREVMCFFRPPGNS